MVSIHAPVRERPRIMCMFQIVIVSIHAPVRERRLDDDRNGIVDVSIHAPVRERRTVQQVNAYCILFQFTLP